MPSGARWFFTECPRPAVRHGPCSRKVFLPGLGSTSCGCAEDQPAVRAGEQQRLQELGPAWLSSSTTVPSLILALLKGFAPKEVNLVLPGELNSPKAAAKCRTPGLCSCTEAVFVLYKCLCSRLPQTQKGCSSDWTLLRLLTFHCQVLSAALPQPPAFPRRQGSRAIRNLLGALTDTAAFGQGQIRNVSGSITEKPKFVRCLCIKKALFETSRRRRTCRPARSFWRSN